MSSKNSNRLFYVTKVSESTFSLYSISTDHLILSEVSEEVISDFLFSNEPSHPALTDEYVSARCNGNNNYLHNYGDNTFRYSKEDYLCNKEAWKTVSCNYTDLNARYSMDLYSTYVTPSNYKIDAYEDYYNPYCSSEQTQYGGSTFNDDSHRQLSFDFMTDLEKGKKAEETLNKLLKDFVDDPDNLTKAHKAQEILTVHHLSDPPDNVIPILDNVVSILERTEVESASRVTKKDHGLHVAGGNNDKGKSHILEDDEWKSYKEWKYLDIEDD